MDDKKVSVDQFVKAAYKGDDDTIARYIVENSDNLKAAVNAVDQDGHTALLEASGNPKATKVVALLLKNAADPQLAHKGGPSPLHYAAMTSHTEAMKLLINSGAKVNATNMYGATPLHYAAANDHTDAMKFLITKGAKIEAFGEAAGTYYAGTKVAQ